MDERFRPRIDSPCVPAETTSMELHTVDPLVDSRWDDLVASHPRASVFHSTGWLRALAKTYGYQPLVVTTALRDMPLSGGIAFCAIRSCVTGARLVSLPFADHAEPLVDDADDQEQIGEWAKEVCAGGGWKYVELRPVTWQMSSSLALAASHVFWLHTMDLRPSAQELYGNLHKDCIRRRILHADREHLEYERGSSDELLRAFYGLLLITRRRHRLLPQPRRWFQNLMSEIWPRPEIRLVRKDGVAIAAIFTLRHRNTVTYKYGCSDERFHRLGGMPFLFWKLIEESKLEGALQIDFGRTETGNHGLTEFKDRLGASKARISYLRYPADTNLLSMESRSAAAARRALSVLPNGVSSRLGGLLYRHVG